MEYILSDFTLLLYRNVYNFCVLILYPATLSNLLMSSSSFLIASLGFSVYSFMLSTNSDNFTSFPIWVPLLLFLLSVLSRTSKMRLNKNSESGHPCVIPDLRVNTWSFSALSMMVAVGLSYMTFIILCYVPYIPTL